eukprot:5708044-Pleurochrysis_carterae.AAC.1
MQGGQKEEERQRERMRASGSSPHPTPPPSASPATHARRRKRASAASQGPSRTAAGTPGRPEHVNTADSAGKLSAKPRPSTWAKRHKAGTIALHTLASPNLQGPSRKH